MEKAGESKDKDHADSSGANLSKEFNACIEVSEGVMPSMIDCSTEEKKRQDNRLNFAYRDALSVATDMEVLRLNQREWIKLRDNECVVDVDSGQAGALNHEQCLALKTAARASELEAMQ